MPYQLYPSILSADFSNLQQVCEMLNGSEADGFHLDVMDGLFVPNISFGFPVIAAIRQHAKKPLDVHLMIANPDRYLKRFRDAGAETLTVHLEACNDIRETIAAIHELGCRASIAIKPESEVSSLATIIAAIHSVCIMSVNPGFGGQAFLEETYDKVSALKGLITQKNAATLIKADGGINLQIGAKLLRAGVDILVAGTSVFSAQDPEKAIHNLKNITINNN